MNSGDVVEFDVIYEEEELERGSGEGVELLESRLGLGQCYKKSFPAGVNTQRMQNYLGKLKENGLDIGKGDATFGYKMPLPEKGDARRDLVIFRRK